jgi:hypothetical protein
VAGSTERNHQIKIVKQTYTLIYLLAIVFCHNFIEIDGANQIIVKISTWISNTLPNCLETSKMDHSIEPVTFANK